MGNYSCSRVIRPNTCASLLTEVQSVEQQLSRGAIDAQKKDELWAHLDDTTRSIRQFQEQVKNTVHDPFHKSRMMESLQSIKNKVVPLYGKIEDRFIDSVLKEITQRGRDLLQSVIDGDIERFWSTLPILQEYVADLKDYRLGKTHAKTLTLAHRNIDVRCSKEGGRLYVEAQGLGEDRLSPGSILIEKEPDIGLVEAEILIELMEIAELFYYSQERRNARKRWAQLSVGTKNMVVKHLAVLGIDSADPEEDTIKTTQALIATARELRTGRPDNTYFTLDDLTILFTEATEVVKGERALG